MLVSPYIPHLVNTLEKECKGLTYKGLLGPEAAIILNMRAFGPDEMLNERTACRGESKEDRTF